MTVPAWSTSASPAEAAPLPASFVLAAWANSWLIGAVSVDDVVDALREQAIEYADAGIAHHLYAADPSGLVALDSPDAEPLTLALGRLRQAGAHSFALALPAPGDPLGLGGPRPFTEAAIDVGEAVICSGAGLGLLPQVVGAGVQWAVREAHPGVGEGLAEADERLARVILDAQDHLAGRGDRGWQAGETGRANASARTGAAAGRARRAAAASLAGLPPNAPARAERVLARSVTCLQIGRFTASEAALGREIAPTGLVSELSAAARRGLVAVVEACQAPARTDR